MPAFVVLAMRSFTKSVVEDNIRLYGTKTLAVEHRGFGWA